MSENSTMPLNGDDESEEVSLNSSASTPSSTLNSDQDHTATTAATPAVSDAEAGAGGALVAKLPSSLPQGSVKAELERLSALAVAAIQDRHFASPVLARWSPDLRSTYEGVPSRLEGRDAMFAGFAAVARSRPAQRTEVLDACAEVDERRGRAKVWLTVVVRGLPGDLCKEGVSLLCWERRKDEWVCWKHQGLRGVEGYT